MKILQLLPEARPADAVSNQALACHRALLELGHEAALGASAVAPELRELVLPAREQLARGWDLILDHYSIAAAYHEELLQSRRRRWLLYHNVTPPGLLLPWAPAIASHCAEGRRQLARLLPGYERRLADSLFNAQELAPFEARALPICVETPPELPRLPLRSHESIFEGRGPLLLFVGRIAPQKNHLALLRLLLRLRRGEFPGAELLLPGDARGFEGYEAALLDAARGMGLGEAVHFLGKVSEAEKWSLYHRADLLCCLSLHEGFCVPVAEAMLAGLPVLASAGTAAEETAGGAALISEPGDVGHAAELAAEALRNAPLREELRRRGRLRALDFSYERLRGNLRALLVEPPEGGTEAGLPREWARSDRDEDRSAV